MDRFLGSLSKSHNVPEHSLIFVNRNSVDEGFPTSRPYHVRENLKRGRLSGTIGSEKSNTL